MQTSTAIFVDHNGTDREVDTRRLQYGDAFKVALNSHIPTDGTVVAGFSEVDESMLTGESRLIEKRIGSVVIAESINCSGMLIIRLARWPGDNTISTIAGMVVEAKLSKPRIQHITNKVANCSVSVVVGLITLKLV